MAINPVGYPLAVKSLLADSGFNFASDTLRVMLVANTYTPADTHQFKNSVTGEITGTGYNARGAQLTGVTWTYDTAMKAMVLAANPLVWPLLTATWRYGVVYKDTGTDSTSRLISYIDFAASGGTEPNLTGQKAELNWGTTGIWRITTP